MNVHALVHARIIAALQALQSDGALPAGLDFAHVEVSPPRDAAHGDLASNAALVLAKAAKMKPRDIADKLAEKLKALPDDPERRGGGRRLPQHALRAGFLAERGGGGAQGGRRLRPRRSRQGRARQRRVRLGQSRPAPCTSAIAAARCSATRSSTCSGSPATTSRREYYINDAGAQVDALARSAYLRYREALGEDIGEIPAGLYPGDYVKPVGAALAKEYGPTLLNYPEERWLPLVRDVAIAAMLVQIREDLAALDVKHDVFFSERSLTAGADEIKITIEELRKKGLVYEGRLEKPKGHDDNEWEDREQTLFRSTDFGDDVDRALMKSDGSYTYFAADMAYHHNKLGRGFLHLINVFGADHAGYLTRVKAAVTALSDGKADLDIKVCQLVKLFRAGEPVRMSKRAGTFVTLREVVDEVGRDPVRFMMLYRKNDAALDFDMAKVLEQSKDNPVFYVQYAHARGKSVFRNARDVFPDLH